MKISGYVFFGIIGLLPVLAMAQQNQTVDKDGWITEKAPSFQTKAPLREGEYPIGFYAGGMAGANIAQDGNLDLTSPYYPGSTVTVKTRDSLGAAVGLRAGYTWPGISGCDGLPPSGVDGSFHVLPTLQGEFLFTGYEYRAKKSFGGVDAEFTADTDIYVFSIQPILKFQIYQFRPFVGFGLGAAYITADNATVGGTTLGSTGLQGSDDSFSLAVQVLGGVEYFVDKHWSITLDYKYLALINPEFDSPDKSVHYSFDSLGNHIIGLGINYYF